MHFRDKMLFYRFELMIISLQLCPPPFTDRSLLHWPCGIWATRLHLNLWWPTSIGLDRVIFDTIYFHGDRMAPWEYCKVHDLHMSALTWSSQCLMMLCDHTVKTEQLDMFSTKCLPLVEQIMYVIHNGLRSHCTLQWKFCQFLSS